MVSDVTAEIKKAVDEYTDDVIQAMNEAAKVSADRAAESLRGSGPARSGKYRRGWKVKDQSGRVGTVSKIVHNAIRGRLTHLLEKGHVNRDGSRTAAKVHIKPVEEQVKRDFENELRSRL